MQWGNKYMNVIERNMDGTFKKGCISANKDNHQVAWNKGMLAEPNEYTTFGDTTVMYIDSEVGDTTEIYLDTQVYEQIKLKQKRRRVLKWKI